MMALGSALAFSSSFFMQNPSYSQEEFGSSESNGVLQRLYSMILDGNSRIRECRNVEMKMPDGKIRDYPLCSIAQEAEIDGVKFRFFAAGWEGHDMSSNNKPINVLKIRLDYGDKPCVYDVNYFSDKNGSFSDRKVFHFISGIFEKTSGEITGKRHEGCWNDYEGKIRSNFEEIRKMHRKAIDDMARTMEINELKTRFISERDSAKK
jgi:hypothetical protein